MKDVNRSALIGLIRLVVLLPILIFVPAWSLNYWQAWTCLVAFCVSSLAITIYLMAADPALLARRMKAGPKAETAKNQKLIQTLAALLFVAIFVVPGFDHRFRWSQMWVGFEIGGDALILAGFAIVFWVFRVNSFTPGVIEVATGQQVICSGPYGVLRHPMYFGALVMLAGIPLSLGSWWGLIAVALMTVAIVIRLLDEERVLANDLKGYIAYTQRVRYRLVPYVW
jgi:protein-S-isoprenylcysteine O-methyltransferase Ste14